MTIIRLVDTKHATTICLHLSCVDSLIEHSAAGSYFLSDAAASLTALTEAARAINPQSNDQDIPVIQIVTDTTSVYTSATMT